ncbi:MAG: PilZ domain-containing protein [bacterium]
MTSDNQERRQSKRKYFTVPICYKRVSESGEGTLAPVKDISEGGIGFLALEYVPPKTDLVLKVFLPGFNEPVESKGTVVWVKREEPYSEDYALFNIGVQFTQLSDKFKELISSFVTAL